MDNELLILQLLSLQDDIKLDKQEGTMDEEENKFNKCLDEIIAESKKHHQVLPELDH